MSIILGALSQERAFLAVDTIAPSIDQPAMPVEVSKMFVVPQIGAAVAVSGNLYLGGFIYGGILDIGRDFDSVAESVLSDDFVGRAEGLLISRLDELDEGKILWSPQEDQGAVALVGFSARLGRMYGVAAHREAGDAGWRAFEFGWLISPPMNGRPAPCSIEDMLDTATIQVREYSSKGPLGGRLLLAQLSRDGIKITSHDIPGEHNTAGPQQ